VVEIEVLFFEPETPKLMDTLESLIPSQQKAYNSAQEALSKLKKR